jgi:hypothetical protein
LLSHWYFIRKIHVISIICPIDFTTIISMTTL